jgi:hypothetical protein
MSDVAFEQRNIRRDAMGFVVENGYGRDSDDAIRIADKFYDYIWEGKHDAEVQLGVVGDRQRGDRG